MGVNMCRLVLRRAFIIISASGPVMSTTGREKKNKYKTKIFRTLNNMQQTEYCQVIASTIRYNIGLIHGANASDMKPPFVRATTYTLVAHQDIVVPTWRKGYSQ